MLISFIDHYTHSYFQCQIRFGGRKEIATDSDSRVICLCAQFEAVLQHGLRKTRGLALTAAALKQAAGFSTKTEGELTFWFYVKEHLNRHELQRFYSLRHISSELGRGRAWLRCALNEHSLERYLHTLLADRPRLGTFYEDWAFILDEERASMLPTMAAGLNSILFAINVDNSDLNGGVTRGGSSVSHLLKESTQGIGSLWKESTQGVSSLLREISTATAVVPGFTPRVDGASDPLPVLPRSSSFCCNTQRVVVVGSLSSVSTWSPLQVMTEHRSSDILIPLNPADSQPGTVDKSCRTYLQSCTFKEDKEILKTLPDSSPPTKSAPLSSVLPTSGLPESMTVVELRQAIVAMMNRKDELEEQNASLRSLLDGEMEHSAGLRQETDLLKRKLAELEERHTAKVQALARENEVLKVQLKKYVGAVQMLKREGSQGDDGNARTHNKFMGDIEELAASYERKLIEVAEMHGELIEFNERLYRSLIAKDHLIVQMRQELIDLRGPVPGDLSQTSDDPSLSDFETAHRALINVWIPSVFLQGRAANAYNVYQVYIRILDNEWNVYRRYTEFRELHNHLRTQFPQVDTFNFPPKKAIGNKDAKFVEERRKQLQGYLRMVMNKLIQTLPEFTARPTKETLLSLLPFCLFHSLGSVSWRDLSHCLTGMSFPLWRHVSHQTKATTTTT
uniref:Sorting nexin 29 n=1 Tax=Sander lucioperca TaxID=283035 RepID=A0A8C9XKS0_SANLU